MRTSKMVRVAVTVVLASCASSFGLEYQWVHESQDYPSTIGGLDVLEYRNAERGGGEWSIEGTGTTDGESGRHLYLMDPPNIAWTAFDVGSTAVSFMMYGDHNDGYAAFFVDGVEVCSQDMHNLGGWSLVVTSLPYASHTISVQQLGTQNPLSDGDDIAIDGGAAVVPEPATLSLVGLGMALMLRKKR